MNYSFSTVFMTVLVSNLIIILIAFCLRWEKVSLSIGYKLLAVFLVLTMVRFLFPVELAFTRTIYFPEFLSRMISSIRHKFFYIGGWSISIASILGCIWLIGICVLLYKHVREYKEAMRYIAAFGRRVTNQEPVCSILEELCGKRANKVEVCVHPGARVPQIFGFFRTRILIPQNMDLNSDEFQFSLKHEIYHYLHRDLLVKEIVQLLCIFYWWNPGCHLLKKQVGLVLEMHVDASLIQGNQEVTMAYLRALIQIKEQTLASKATIPDELTIFMFSGKESELEHRFKMMCQRPQKSSIMLYMSLLVVVVIMYLGSFCIILEARNLNMLEEAENIRDTSKDFYAIEKSDGTYDLYWQGMFMENLENLEYYPFVQIIKEDENVCDTSSIDASAGSGK